MKNALQLFYKIAVWESDKSDTCLMFGLNYPIELQSLTQVVETAPPPTPIQCCIVL